MMAFIVKGNTIINAVLVRDDIRLPSVDMYPYIEGKWIGDQYLSSNDTELAQQRITDLELNDIASGQKMTDLELMILGIGGGTGVQ